MAKFRRDRNAHVDNQLWYPRNLDDLSKYRQTLLDQAMLGSHQAHAALLTSYWPVMKAYFGSRL